MSSNKYADLPDIDTAPDVYETEDVFPSTQTVKGDESDDEALTQRSARGRTDGNSKEDIDSTNLMTLEDASAVFRKAERRHGRVQTYYACPPSPTSSESPSDLAASRSLPLSRRLRALQNEISVLEAELADPSNPLLAREAQQDQVDPGDLIRGIAEVKARLDKVRKGREGRGKLVSAVMSDGGEKEQSNLPTEGADKNGTMAEAEDGKSEVMNVVEIDRRVGELEKLVGSSSAALEESSPLPPPLLPLMTRLNAQLTLLTQPRHLDSISRRLKLLLSDLDRVSAQHQAHRRNTSQLPSPSQQSQIQEHILPLLSRLGPMLPQIPHILSRLRTLSALHTSAAEFQETVNGLGEEQRKMQVLLAELEEAVKMVEKSLQENRGVVRKNVTALENRVELLLRRLDHTNTGGLDNRTVLPDSTHTVQHTSDSANA